MPDFVFTFTSNAGLLQVSEWYQKVLPVSCPAGGSFLYDQSMLFRNGDMYYLYCPNKCGNSLQVEYMRKNPHTAIQMGNSNKMMLLGEYFCENWLAKYEYIKTPEFDHINFYRTLRPCIATKMYDIYYDEVSYYAPKDLLSRKAFGILIDNNLYLAKKAANFEAFPRLDDYFVPEVFGHDSFQNIDSIGSIFGKHVRSICLSENQKNMLLDLCKINFYFSFNYLSTNWTMNKSKRTFCACCQMRTG